MAKTNIAPNGERHDVTVIEQEMPGGYEAHCICGWCKMTPRGRDHMGEIVERHFRDHGVTKVKVRI